ncbi:MAG: hypothetical protein ACXWF8_07825 [Methylobacter sp.]
MTFNKKRQINCPLAGTKVIIFTHTFMGISGLGDERPYQHTDYECSQENCPHRAKPDCIERQLNH